MPDRLDSLLRAQGERLEAESRAAGEALDHRGAIGGTRERLLRDTLTMFLPRRYAISTGFVLGPGDEISEQQDILIYDGERYPSFVQTDLALLVPESVQAAISVRSVLRPADFADHIRSTLAFKELCARAVPAGPMPLYVLFAFRFEGDWQRILDSYGEHVFATAPASRLDLIAALEGGGVCLDASRFSGAGAPQLPADLVGRVHVFGMHFHASVVAPMASPFVDFFKLILSGLTGLELSAPPTHTIAPSTADLRGRAAPATPDGVDRRVDKAPLRAEFSGKSVDLRLAPGQAGQFAIIFFNAGDEPWVRGTETEARLAVLSVPGDDTLEVTQQFASGWFAADTFATQSAEVIPPAHNAFFIFNVVVPQGAKPGPRRFHCQLVADGQPLTPESYAHTLFIEPALVIPAGD